MCRVDLMDGLISLYKYNLRSKRWYMYLFYHTIHLAMNNAWLLYKCDCTIIGSKPLRLREFISAVCNSLETRNRQNMRGTKKHRSSSISADIRYDETSHWPAWSSNRVSSKTLSFCAKNATRSCASMQTEIVSEATINSNRANFPLTPTVTYMYM